MSTGWPLKATLTPEERDRFRMPTAVHSRAFGWRREYLDFVARLVASTAILSAVFGGPPVRRADA